MKIISSKKVKKHYRVVMDITDSDVELFEDLAQVYVTKGSRTNSSFDREEHEFLPYIKKQCNRWYHELWLHCWNKFD